MVIYIYSTKTTNKTSEVTYLEEKLHQMLKVLKKSDGVLAIFFENISLMTYLL